MLYNLLKYGLYLPYTGLYNDKPFYIGFIYKQISFLPPLEVRDIVRNKGFLTPCYNDYYQHI